MPMVEVRLHGQLAVEFGKCHRFDILSPKEAIRALSVNFPEFMGAIQRLTDRGSRFRVCTKDHEYSDHDLDFRFGSSGRVDIVPIITGSSAGVRFVTGAVLLIAGFYTGGATWGPMMMSMGASLMLGSVVEWLAPKPDKVDREEGLKSWALSGPSNDGGPGSPVPIIFGEVLTGGIPISGAIATTMMDRSGATGQMVHIGGQFDVAASTPGATTSTIVLELSAVPFNLDEPYTYAWSYSGLSTAAAVRLIGADRMVVRVEIDSVIPTNSQILHTGSVTVTCTGRVPGTEGETTTVSRTESVRVIADNITPNSEGGF